MIRAVQVNIHVGDFHVKNVNFQVPTGQYGVVMGHTGSGKTTLLESIAGLTKIESGSILLGKRDVTKLKPAERNLGYVPQDGALFPTMSVEQHLAFPLHIRGLSSSEIAHRVGDLADLLGLQGLMMRRTHGLSGGEKQRVALGRALSYHPQTLLLDEPLSALDDATREQMYELLKLVQAQAHVTILHVTHSTEEANALADCLFNFHQGELTVGKPPQDTE